MELVNTIMLPAVVITLLITLNRKTKFNAQKFMSLAIIVLSRAMADFFYPILSGAFYRSMYYTIESPPRVRTDPIPDFDSIITLIRQGFVNLGTMTKAIIFTMLILGGVMAVFWAFACWRYIKADIDVVGRTRDDKLGDIIFSRDQHATNYFINVKRKYVRVIIPKDITFEQAQAFFAEQRDKLIAKKYPAVAQPRPAQPQPAKK